MATWIAHMRVAENILNKDFEQIKEIPFLVGNLGPDCSKPNEDWSEFDPPKKVTHWIDDNNAIQADRFYNTYISHLDCKDNDKFSFLLGYYTHLLSDIEWSKMISYKRGQDDLYSRLNEDKKFIWTIKKDWYDLDHLYLRNHKDSIFHRVFKNINGFPDYLDYYPKNAVARQIRYISTFYESFEGNLDREYKYLTEEEMNQYVENTTKVIINAFNNKYIGM